MSEFKGVQLKRSIVPAAVPSAAQLVDGELAINLVDQKLYSKDNSGNVFQVKGAVESITGSVLTSILSAVYPVGSLYTNADVNTNPATLLGFGTWVEFGAGRVIVGQNTSDTSFDVLGETGGSKDAIVVSHTHSVTDPGHSHSSFVQTQIGGTSSGPDANWWRKDASSTGSATTGISIASAGSSGTNANLPPYIVVKMWKRTA